MLLTTGRFGGEKNFIGQLPKFGVYRREDWELMGSGAMALSLHQDYKSAEDAAAKVEDEGVRQRVECALVEFDYSQIPPEPRTPLTERRDDPRS